VITVHGWDVSQQMLLSGVVQGLAYAVLAAGIVLVYRASGVINLAVVAFGTTAVAFTAVLLGGGIGGWHAPFWFAFVLATVVAAFLGALVEWAVIRRLSEAPRLVLLVATIGVAQVLLLVALLLPDPVDGGFFPPLLDWTWTVSPELTFQGRELSVIIIVPLLVMALAMFLTRTRTGLMVRAAAANADKARLVGIRVFRTSSVVWAVSAASAAVAAIALAPVRGVSVAGAAAAGGALSYQLLLRALVVALIARMRSLPITLVAGIGVGIVEVILQQNVAPSDLGVTELWLFVATLFIVLVYSRLSGASDDGWKLAGLAPPRVERTTAPWWLRHLPRLGVVALFAVLVLIPVFFSRASQSFLWTRVLVYAIAACSLTILTGWAGQLSLGQFGFAAVGGLTTVKLVGGGFLGLHHLPWAIAVGIGVLVGAAVAVLIGLPALRVPGLYLAVTTLAFAVFVSVWLVGQATFVDADGLLPTLAKPDAGIVDFSSRRSYYYLCLAVLAGCLAVVAQLRRTGIARSVIAARDNPESAAAMTISTTRVKLLAFAVSGGMAALAGCLLVTLLPSNTPAVTFAPEESVRVVAILVIGGLGALVGPVLGALWVVGVPAIWPNEPVVPVLVSGVGILAILLFAPGGFAGILRALEDRVRVRTRAVDRRPAPPASPGGAILHAGDAGSLVESVESVESIGGDWLTATGMTVRFGGRVALDEVDVRVAPHELVGLIGTNGAGKSTLMNAIGGFLRAEGRVVVLGHDVSRLPAYRRHRQGLGRTFQAARLYDDLTVRETVMVALERRSPSRLVPSMFHVPPSPGAERAKRAEADEILAALGLGETADRRVAELSTGTRRMVELASQVALGARVLLLDEPTAGLSQRETEAFAPRIREIQRDLGAAVLLIEHDMPLVMSISDRVYCLEAGRVIAEGSPAGVRADPLVVASYLGADAE
jgi:ABC-type branched-subunit amino acid transport system ATPase component/ABC-type branched-subunit amino acid transport system permease subunit